MAPYRIFEACACSIAADGGALLIRVAIGIRPAKSIVRYYYPLGFPHFEALGAEL
jgi:hypothetical protein